MGERGGGHLSKALLSSYKQGVRALVDRVGGGATCRNSTIIFKSVLSGLTGIILVFLGTVNLQFQHPFVPITLQPVLRTVAAHVLGTVWSSCS